MTSFLTYQESINLLKRARRPLFILLKDIDADALGSAVALAAALQASSNNESEPTLISRSEVPTSLKFVLPPHLNWQTVGSDFDLSAYDLMIIGDCGHLGRTGFVEQIENLKAQGVPLLNIDHHHVHQDFGTVNLVDAQASSTAEITYDLIKFGDWSITPAVATAILTGITADTDAFTNAATTVRSLEIAAQCYASGADSRIIVKELYQGKALNALKLWGVVLARLVKNKKWGIVSTVVLQEDLLALDMDDEATDGLANFMNTITDMKAAMIIRELPNGQIRASLRSVRDDIDVSQLVKVFGGGGHKKAAGFTLPGQIVQTNGRWQIKI
jgi:phosphoesterase RecJ-like protein